MRLVVVPPGVTMPGHETMMALKHGGANALLALDVDGGEQLALTKDVQIDPIRRVIEHVDFVAVKRGEMMSTLQDADAQAQGAIDLAIVAKQADYAPKAAVWDVNGGKLAWEGGKQQHYSVPWIPVTLENVDGLLEMRKTQ